MNRIKSIERTNEAELALGVTGSASWHAEFAHSPYIFVGGLPYELTEGDILTVFSQYGIVVGIKLHRDKETGKSKGFAFLRYDDPRSCILAVDNFNGISLLNRRLAVNHVKEYKQADEMDVVAEQTLDNLSDEDERESTKKRKEKRREAKSLDLVKAVMSQDPIQQQLAIEKVKRREERKRQRRERNAEQVDPDTEQEESSQRNQEDFANARASSSGNDNAELT